jgi:hypothetical protein
MDTSAFVKAIAADESWLDSLTPWLVVASFIVIVGLVIELWPDAKKLHWWHWDGDLFMEAVGGAIVTLGIAGELMLAILASRAETALRKDNGQYVALLEKETETLREQNLALKSEFAWRHLNDGQWKKVLLSLSHFPGMPYDCEIADSEALNFLIELSKVLSAPAVRWVAKSDIGARMVIRTSNGVAIGTFIGMDITISYGAERAGDFGPAARALAEALVAEGIKARYHEDPNDNRDVEKQHIYIRIGSKSAF